MKLPMVVLCAQPGFWTVLLQCVKIIDSEHEDYPTERPNPHDFTDILRIWEGGSTLERIDS